MFVSIRRYRIEPGTFQEIAKEVRESFLPVISKAKGFIEYHLIESGEDSLTVVNIFNDRAGAEESNRLAADFVRKNLSDYDAELIDTIIGNSVVQKSKQPV